MLTSESALELFCGIGGFAAVCDGLSGPDIGQITAVDIDRTALEVHAHNFPQRRRMVAELASFDAQRVDADFWWLSPPCLPFTRKGVQRDLADRRNQALLHLIGQIGVSSSKPIALAIENVPPFALSQTATWVVEHLQQAGFETAWEIRCPSELGWPMRRKRAYLLASRLGLHALPPADFRPTRLAALLDGPPACDGLAAELQVPAAWRERFADAIDIVEAADPAALAACFTSSYGRSPVRSGSYLRGSDGSVRLFTPAEIVRCLGFADSFRWPTGISLRRQWDLAGNSLSLPVVRWVLQRIFLS
jgi:DNA (cytosine-5)-methyltransferase 1